MNSTQMLLWHSTPLHLNHSLLVGNCPSMLQDAMLSGIVDLQGCVTNTADGFIFVILIGHYVVSDHITIRVLSVQPMLLKLCFAMMT